MKAKRQARTFLQVIQPKYRVLRAFKLLENHGCCRRYQWIIFGINLSSNLQLMQIISLIKAKRQRMIMFKLKTILCFHVYRIFIYDEYRKMKIMSQTHTLLSLFRNLCFVPYLPLFPSTFRILFQCFPWLWIAKFCNQLRNFERYLV